MVALLVGIAIMGVMMAAAMPVWRQAAQREKEAELAFRGEQYARAIGLFQRKYAASFPPNLEVLVQQKFLRKKYKDPVTKEDFQILYQAASAQRAGEVATGTGRGTGSGPGSTTGVGRQTSVGGRDSDDDDGAPTSFGGGSAGTLGPRGGIVGVASKSKDKSIRLYKGRGRYNEWEFVYIPVTQKGGQGGEGAERPGAQSGPGSPQVPGGANRPGVQGGLPGAIGGGGPGRRSGGAGNPNRPRSQDQQTRPRPDIFQSRELPPP
jgi:type II secretory pathway pseudopilin PulG